MYLTSLSHLKINEKAAEHHPKVVATVRLIGIPHLGSLLIDLRECFDLDFFMGSLSEENNAFH